MSRSYVELARKHARSSDLEDALFAVKRGEIAQFALIRKLQKPSGEYWLTGDESAVWRACYECGIPTATLEAWRIQFDALPQTNP